MDGAEYLDIVDPTSDEHEYDYVRPSEDRDADSKIEKISQSPSGMYENATFEGKNTADNAYESLKKAAENEARRVSCTVTQVVFIIILVLVLMAVACGLGWYLGFRNNSDSMNKSIMPCSPNITNDTGTFTTENPPNNVTILHTTASPLYNATILQTTVKEWPEKTEEQWCDDYGSKICTTDGWLVWLRRVDNSVSFNRTWDEYKNGFGDVDGNFWLGLEKLHNIIGGVNKFQLRADLVSWENEERFAVYNSFSVADETMGYLLSIDEYNSNSTAVSKLYLNDGYRFVTRDTEIIFPEGSCVEPAGQGGGWWYHHRFKNWRPCSDVLATSPIGDEGQSGSYMRWILAFGDRDAYKNLQFLTMMIKPSI